ncbi:MAG: PQQ-dependent sugar dehydrogenase [Planctomycetales bacterium]
MNTTNRPLPVLRPTTVVTALILASCSQWASAAESGGEVIESEDRKAWTTSRLKGSPEPPLPYRAQRVFQQLNFEQPTVLTNAPGTDRLFVAEQKGRIFSIPNDTDCKQANLFLDANELVEQLNARLAKDDQVTFGSVYGLTFHPNFASNRRCYVCYTVNAKRGKNADGTRVVEVRVDKNDPPRAIVDSETQIISWLVGGHNGGCLKFGPDGMLYISTGDGGAAFPPDGHNTGQDVSDLLAGVLRIDIDRPQADRAYSIPGDNPFVKLDGARGEVWAYGMRNPWKMSFDRKTGNLWVGDVGWELWELVYQANSGDNFGWSLFEGRQPVHAERKRGPTPIVPPTVEIPHTEGASITGGFVYRGNRLPELKGHYIFGDWETRRFWGISVDGDKIGERKELVEPSVRIVGFAERNDGELLLLDHDSGTIHELVRNNVANTQADFPRRLSETGLFQSVASHQPAEGIVPFSIHAPQWSDYATAERWLGLPHDASIGLQNRPTAVDGSMFKRALNFPNDAVLMKTLSLEFVHGDPTTNRKVETQILHFNGYDWRGYSYRWNAEQTDAELVDSTGETAAFEISDATAPGGQRRQSWRFPSRMDCIRCHNPWAEFSLAFNVAQLNRTEDQTGENQLERLQQMGVFHEASQQLNPEDPYATAEPAPPLNERPELVDPFDESVDIRLRARAYLHVNCAHCHRFNGGGAAKIYLPFDTSIYKTEAVATRPTQGTFGIHDAMIIAPTDPYRSVLYFRMAKAGPGHMPHLGSQYVDQRGLSLIHDWIHLLPPDIELAQKIDELAGLDESAELKREQRNSAFTRWTLARKIAETDKREVTTQADRDAAQEQAIVEAAGRVTKRERRRAQLIKSLLADPRGAVALVRAEREKRLPNIVSTQLLIAAAQHASIAVRDLFEPLLPDGQKTERLGDSIDASQLLKLTGNVDRGKELFLKAKGIQCRNCHRFGKQGKQLGPDLIGIGKKLTKDKLLESLLEPSRTIDPKFTAWLIETDEGKVFNGLLVQRTDEKIVIRDTEAKEITFDAEHVEGIFPQRKSLMPDRLLRDLTAQQAADLIEWLASLK